MSARPYAVPALSLTVLILVGAAVHYARKGDPSLRTPDASAPDPRGATSGGRLETPYPIEPFFAVDLDGRDVSFFTWTGKVVVVNVWATWCAPCRREIPALAALQDKYRDRLLVIGLLQDNVTTDFAREFGKSVRINYPIVRSTFDIERHLPQVLALPMTFVVDTAGRLVTMYAGEIDPAQVERDVMSLLPHFN